jgi:hypothetical protein
MVDAQLRSVAILNELPDKRREEKTRRTPIANRPNCSDAQFVTFLGQFH